MQCHQSERENISNKSSISNTVYLNISDQLPGDHVEHLESLPVGAAHHEDVGPGQGKHPHLALHPAHGGGHQAHAGQVPYLHGGEICCMVFYNVF